MPRRPHRLALYLHAVQHPLAEAVFLQRVYHHYRKRWPTTLREDFAGTAAVATQWVALSEDHRAIAVDRHGPTLRWAVRRAQRELGHRVEDLHPLFEDVMWVGPPRVPRVDLVCALNFSSFVYHDRPTMLAYLRHARRNLRAGGVLVLDAFGGPGAMRVGTQRRRVGPEPGGLPGFEYRWEQRSFDAVAGRIDCRIHFSGRGWIVNNAFRYDWRLWTLPELRGMMMDAGFSAAEVWGPRRPGAAGVYDGRFRPLSRMPAGEDFVAFVVGVR